MTLQASVLNKLRNFDPSTASKSDRTRLLEEVKADAKLQFESRRSEIMRNLMPLSLSAPLFGQIGFVDWRNRGRYAPVLTMSPYDVAPGPVRTTWFSKYEKVRNSQRIVVNRPAFLF